MRKSSISQLRQTMVLMKSLSKELSNPLPLRVRTTMPQVPSSNKSFRNLKRKMEVKPVRKSKKKRFLPKILQSKNLKKLTRR